MFLFLSVGVVVCVCVYTVYVCMSVCVGVCVCACANVGQTLTCNLLSPDPEQRSTGEKRPIPHKRPSNDFPDSSCYQRNAAIVPHHSLLPYR